MESKKINQLATELTPSLSDLTIIGDPSTGISKKITLSQMASLFTGTVEEYASLAAFPLVGVADTIYIALDTNVLYRWDTGLTSYVELSPNIINSLVFNDANGFDGTISLVGSVATLTITTALTTGSVGFIGASGALLQDNANFFWDDSNNRLGIGTNAPTTALDVFGSGIIGRVNGTSTNNAFLGFASAGSNKWSIGNVQSDHRFRIYNEATTSELVSVLQTGEFGIGIANPTTKFHIDGGASALIANLDANVSVAKSISFRSDNSNRINLEVSGTESGSNAGANFFLRAYSDAGALLSTPLTIERATGAATFSNVVTGNRGSDNPSFIAIGSNNGNGKIQISGSSSYTIAGGTDYGGMSFIVGSGEKFFINAATSVATFSGNIIAPSITTSAYSYLYGLRISGNDTTNTIYSSSANMGITADSGYNIFIGQAGATTIGLNISTTTGGATLNGVLTVNSGASATTTNFKSSGDFISNWIGNSTSQFFSIRNNTNVGVYLNTQNSVPLVFGVSTGTTGGTVVNHLSIAPTGAASFSNSVTAKTSFATAGTNASPVFEDWLMSNPNGSSTLTKIQIGNSFASSAGTWIKFSVNSSTGVNTPVDVMTLKYDGNVGIGTSSPSDKLTIVGGNILVDQSSFGTAQLRVKGTGTTTGFDIQNSNNDGYLWNRDSGNIYFATANTERARITSGGQVLINRTATSGQPGRFQIETTGTDAIYIKQSAAGGYGFAMSAAFNAGLYYYMFFEAGTTGVGSITSNGTTTSYNTTSDYRLKQDLKDYNGLDLICNIKTYDYEWKSNKSRSYGVLAHELFEIIPDAVTGEKDAENMQGVDYSKIVPVLVKSIQQLKAELNELKSK
jgi:hypothetical protein